MNSHLVSITTWLSAFPLAEWATLGIRSPNPHPTLSQTHSFVVTGAGAFVSPSGREKGAANITVLI
jgi:hypothetical protein